MKLAKAHLRRTSLEASRHSKCLAGQATVSLRLAVQIEPVSRDIAVIVPDIEIVGILAQRARHCDGLLTPVTSAKS